MPDEAMWQEFADLCSEHPAKWMIWEEEPLPEVAARLESMGLESVVFAPCAGKPSGRDFLEVMQINLTALGVVYEDR